MRSYIALICLALILTGCGPGKQRVLRVKNSSDQPIEEVSIDLEGGGIIQVSKMRPGELNESAVDSLQKTSIPKDSALAVKVTGHFASGTALSGSSTYSAGADLEVVISKEGKVSVSQK